MLYIFIKIYLIVRVFGINSNIRSEDKGITWSQASSTCKYGLESDKDVIRMSDFTVNLTFWIGNVTFIGTGLEKLDDMALPVCCITGMMHYRFGVPMLLTERRECNNPLYWYLCKSHDDHVSSNNAKELRFSENSLSTQFQNGESCKPNNKSLVDVITSVSQTTVEAHTKMTEKKEEVHNKDSEFPIGAIVAGVLGVVVVIGLALGLVLCKIRSCGIFKAPKIEQHDVFSSNFTNVDSNVIVDISSVITSNQTYGIANSCESNSNTYATVNKGNKPCSSSKAKDDTYTDSSYDRLNEVQKRKILATDNLYDINEGTRNENDPTYNSADFCERKTNNHGSDMDTYSIMSTQVEGLTEHDKTLNI